MVVRDFHERAKHQGRGITLNGIRSNGYWIIQGTAAVSKCIAGCTVCHKLRGTTHGKKMADLPIDRVEKEREKKGIEEIWCSRQLRSDQGTNFVGAKGQLKDAISELAHEKISSEMLKDHCDWVVFKMNVPSANHMGGSWEKQIRTVLNVLSGALDTTEAQLDDESLRTLLCEVEAIVNNRPLTVDSKNDPDSLSPLTPNH